MLVVQKGEVAEVEGEGGKRGDKEWVDGVNLHHFRNLTPFLYKYIKIKKVRLNTSVWVPPIYLYYY